jgi:gliding motility-associated-like protein
MHFVMIEPPLPKVDLGDDVSGCMPLTVEFPSTTKYIYTDSYQWDLGYLDQVSTEKKPDALVFDTAGTYIVRLAVAGDGGTNWDYKVVKVYPQPVSKYSFTPDSAWVRSQTEPGKPIMFINLTDRALSYTWDFGDGSPNSSEFQPDHEYMNEGLYTVSLTAENEQGCVDTYIGKSVLIMAHGELRFPNVITITPGSPAAEYYDPDGFDDINIFRPVNEGIDKYKLQIYNRWGEVIFESDEVTKGWNGFIKGSPVKQDVYVWRVSAVFTNGRPYIDAGDVTVLVRQP